MVSGHLVNWLLVNWSSVIGHFPFSRPQRLEDHQGHKERVVDQIPPPEAPGFGEQAEEPFQAGALHPVKSEPLVLRLLKAIRHRLTADLVKQPLIGIRNRFPSIAGLRPLAGSATILLYNPWL